MNSRVSSPDLSVDTPKAWRIRYTPTHTYTKATALYSSDTADWMMNYTVDLLVFWIGLIVANCL